MAYIVPLDLFGPLVGGAGRTYIAYWPIRDMDDAFDAAARAAQALDPDQPSAWLDYASAGDVVPASEVPVTWDEALSDAVRVLTGDLPEGTCHGMPVAVPSGHVRTKVRVPLDSTALMLPDAPALLLPGDGRVRAAFDLIVAAAGPLDGSVQRVELAAVRRRFRPKATPVKGPSASAYAIVDGERIVARGFRTATEARREAIAMLRAMDPTVRTQPELDVVKLVMREAGPFVEVRRELIAQKGRAAVHLASAKGETVKQAGWLFYGRA